MKLAISSLSLLKNRFFGMEQYDYIIAGQGTAGICLAYYLQKEGQKVLLVDDVHPFAASRIAAGIINPVTGRRIVKTWMIDHLFPFAEQFYSEMQSLLKIPENNLVEKTNVLWCLNDIAKINDFIGKSAMPGYDKYITGVKSRILNKSIKEFKACVTIKALRIDTALLNLKYREYAIQNNFLIEDTLLYKDICITKNKIVWRNFEAKKMIFCEGWKGQFNPYFSYLPFLPAKGDILIIESPDLDTDGHIIKNNIFIVPLKNRMFWVGATYDRDNINENRSEEAYQNLIKNLEATINVNYRVANHLAGIRPTTYNRRPFIGLHPEHPELGIFNGLGTKGTSYAPYFALQFVEHLLHGRTIDKEADIGQYNP